MDAAALGATPDRHGTTFAAWSSVAERVEVCLFGPDGAEADRVELARHDGRWEAHVAGVAPGHRYGFRVHGPGDPANGLACDPSKLLVDPAARRVAGDVRWTPELLEPGVDSAPFVPRSVVDAPPCPGAATQLGDPRPWDEQLVYEAHIGHLTARHPMVGPDHRGRYPGLAAPVVIDHLLRLGVTAVELLPVQHFTSEPDLVATGRRNVWGYNPLAWGAPHEAYATSEGDPIAELRAAIAALHEAGIEVWLDVVFNHTCEGSLGTGPILSWRGFDNPAAYRLIPGEGGAVDEDVTGCGNAIDTRSTWIRGLVRQCLVRWVQEFGVDGFRFDLAATLIREDDGPTAHHPLLAELAAEPALAGARLVAEPWDTGLGGYAPGRFPPPWREWNDRFRDDVRGTWRGEPGGWSAFADRLTGSGDRYRGDGPAEVDPEVDGRGATTGVNAVATHDGFTLADLVTWVRPVGGGHDQRSSNGGIEGPTSDPVVGAIRRRRQRAMLATLLCAQGVPMVHSGDELGTTQGGVADGYTLEPAAWGLDWAEADWDLVAWVAAAAHLRRRHPALRRPGWVDPDDAAVRWLTPAGEPFTDDDWHHGRSAGLQMVLAPEDPADATALLLVAPREPLVFQLPAGPWWCHLDAAEARPGAAGQRIPGGGLPVEAPGALLLLSQP